MHAGWQVKVTTSDRSQTPDDPQSSLFLMRMQPLRTHQTFRFAPRETTIRRSALVCRTLSAAISEA